MTAQTEREKSLRYAQDARRLMEEASNSTDETRKADLQTQADRALEASDEAEARAKKFDAIEEREASFNTADPRRPTEDRAVETKTSKTREERHAEIFNAFIRGDELSPELRAVAREFRDQSVGTNSAGGYLVPTSLLAQLIVGLKLYGPMMNPDAVNHLNTAAGNPLNIPSMDDTANAGALITEAASISTNSLTFGQKALGAYKYTSGFFKVSSELLQDAAIDPAQIVIDAIVQRLGRILNTHLTTGTGSGQPTGLVTAVGTPSLVSAGAGAVAYGDIVELFHSVDPLYRNNPKTAFMMSDSTLKVVRKLLDSQGHPIWEPNVKAGTPQTLIGEPFLINQDMATVATGNVPMLFGDFSKYWVRVARDVAVKRADERFIDTDEVAFVGFARVDGNLMDSRAVKGLKIQ